MSGSETAVLGGGCFWCVEAVYQRLDGVSKVVSGYAGGSTADPTYGEICTGGTGHAEVIQVTFDPDVISFAELLGWFWRAHDPTTKDRQGADVGTQYRSIILAADGRQLEEAKASRDAAQRSFKSPIVTEIDLLDKFWEAEIEHQDYFNRNRMAPYCMLAIAPKLSKLDL